MTSIFIAHAWSSDTEYNKELLNFMKLLQVELEDKKYKVIYDDNTKNKQTLKQFMKKNIKESDVIIAICDENYLNKSEDEKSGVYYELNEIKEHDYLNKVIPLKIYDGNLPYDFASSEYYSFEKEFRMKKIDSSDNIDALFVRIADLLHQEELIPQDKIDSEKLTEIDSIGMLSNILKSELYLSDIYTYPELRIDKKDTVSFISAQSYLEKEMYVGKSIIVGDRQSGKSSFGKKIFLDLYNKGFQPIYLEKDDIKSTNITKIVFSKYIETYLTQNKRKESNIILIVDDFHTLPPNQQDVIRKLDDFKGVIILVDDIYDVSSPKDFIFSRFTIQPLKPTLRGELIGKVIDVQENLEYLNPNDKLKRIDESSALVDASLGIGKGYRNGILPAFPLYILIIIGSVGDITSRLDSPVSSYGHCYQLLISLAFQNCGIQNDKIDSYINFLTYFSIYLYNKGVVELTDTEFDQFLEDYQKDFRIFELKKYLKLLFKTGLIKKTNSLYYRFTYDYLYYFFLGKYLSEHFDERIEDINNIILNLDDDKNGNICIFIAHHCKNDRLIEMLNTSLEEIFTDYSPSILDKNELGNFDESLGSFLDNLKVKIENHTERRKKELEYLDKIEQDDSFEEHGDLEIDSREQERHSEIRRSIQTVEVIGIILKNRHGSIKKDDFEKILNNTVDASLRLLKSFIEIVSNEEFLIFLENYLVKNMQTQIADISEEELKKEIRDVISTMNFATIYTLIMKTISSIGSEVISKYFSEMHKGKDNLAPSYKLILRGMELNYEKRFPEKEILKDIKSKEMSNIAVTIMKLLVFNHLSRHNYTIMEKSKYEKLFGFKHNSLLVREQQIKALENK